MAIKKIQVIQTMSLPIKDRLKVLEAALELYSDAVNNCNVPIISTEALKIGITSSSLRTELKQTINEESLKSLVDLNLLEKNFRIQQNKLNEGHCKCKIKGKFW